MNWSALLLQLISGAAAGAGEFDMGQLLPGLIEGADGGAVLTGIAG